MSLPPLLEHDADPDPIAQFSRWYAEVEAAGQAEPTVMTLATATPEGVPSARMVLLKHAGPDGFDFYTNYDSRKAAELAANPRVALVFWWERLRRQVRVEGMVVRLPSAASAAYFATRPRGSRIGAWASPQSRVLAGRAELERRVAEIEQRFAGQDVPLPPFWGGYRVHPWIMEFWQERGDRLHDRLRYRREGDGWVMERLAP
ncbi:MAG: Pyridoxine/pyridoxamine 5'-phosphate oxidase [candidate division BRC1 bacterium ADurb.BinA292]|nr:MAG: Pyridoxine/pyridoxamine 5'-phosphate oxidase [candidate division BRC1 bacterium ADurb.BinA292]